MANKLEVKDLRVSFRTVSGKLKAVRDISFTLKEGETLAIVGESGSGKSVTSKSILGILAGNSIVEGGEILYDGMDLLKISEDEFYKIRGDKIAMIFQDPLSSLNPIMKIGKQLTEAMLLKGKARQKASRTAFNTLLKTLSETMVAAMATGNDALAAELKQMCQNFDKFEFKHIELEKAYNQAFNAADECISELKNILFLIEKNALKDAKRELKEKVKLAKDAIHPFVVSGEDAETLTSAATLVESTVSAAVRSGSYAEINNALLVILAILEKSVKKTAPNYFSMGYYLTFSGQPLPEMPVEELNAFLRSYLDENFMLKFIENVVVTLKYSAALHDEAKAAVVAALKDALVFVDENYSDNKKMDELAAKLSELVRRSIDPLETRKDSVASTFSSSLKAAVDVYFTGVKKNAGEIKRFEKEQAKFDAFVTKNGRTPDWKVVPAATVDLELALSNIKKLITNLCSHYEEVLVAHQTRDFEAEGVAIIDYLKQNASGVVNKITRRMAKLKALKLMEEVGIPEPRKRYKQYPFEFSGGMRQRIVIAIALAADPDILICDEPTTALDVTIQAQILELINRLKAERNLSIIFITHDLGVVANMADKIAVMYAGKIVEYGTSNDVFYEPAHPYTWALLSSMPDLDTNERLEAIPGTPPNMIYPPKGDAFADRNKYAMAIDYEEQPPLFRISETHSAATWLLHPDAPKVEPPKIVRERIERMKERRNGTNE